MASVVGTLSLWGWTRSNPARRATSLSLRGGSRGGPFGPKSGRRHSPLLAESVGEVAVVRVAKIESQVTEVVCAACKPIRRDPRPESIEVVTQADAASGVEDPREVKGGATEAIAELGESWRCVELLIEQDLRG